MSETKEKPFPMPGTVWAWTGDAVARPQGRALTVTSLRWFSGEAEAMFDDGASCASIKHMMTSDAWAFLWTEKS